MSHESHLLNGPLHSHLLPAAILEPATLYLPRVFPWKVFKPRHVLCWGFEGGLVMLRQRNVHAHLIGCFFCVFFLFHVSEAPRVPTFHRYYSFSLLLYLFIHMYFHMC
ncbi:hypothetical protein F5Y03DRAFT_1217 [Xylaria venustula]|nr:hypothetical protein F5Y03DRAFT_1217 [Xylaria venustula]